MQTYVANEAILEGIILLCDPPTPNCPVVLRLDFIHLGQHNPLNSSSQLPCSSSAHSFPPIRLLATLKVQQSHNAGLYNRGSSHTHTGPQLKLDACRPTSHFSHVIISFSLLLDALNTGCSLQPLGLNICKNTRIRCAGMNAHFQGLICTWHRLNNADEMGGKRKHFAVEFQN